MKIKFVRGQDIFIVEKDGKYYLVNLELESCSLAEPPNIPDMFLKFGYFEEVKDIYVSESTKDAIIKIMKESKNI